MKRLALAGIAAALSWAGLAAASTSPWTAKGTVTALHKHSITVHGHNCRLEGAFGGFVFSRWAVGDGAKIACSHGVLLKIAVLPLPSITATTPAPKPPSGASTSSGGVTFTLGGSLTVSAVSSDSITVALGITPPPGSALQSSYTCTIGPSSPPTGLQVGDRVTRFGCSNGVLTSLTRG